MHCFACNADVPLAAGDRIGFRDDCSRCQADLHVCRNCVHHDPTAYNECRESSSERVSDRERANRCDYFRPGNAEGFRPGNAESFRPGSAEGGSGEPAKQTLSDLEALFKK